MGFYRESMIWETEDGQYPVSTIEDTTFEKWAESDDMAFFDGDTLYVKKRDENGDWYNEEIAVD